jgi:hypothetical protein
MGIAINDILGGVEHNDLSERLMNGEVITIGKFSSNDIVLGVKGNCAVNDATIDRILQGVSRMHAEIYFNGHSYRVFDRSKNGITVRSFARQMYSSNPERFKHEEFELISGENILHFAEWGPVVFSVETSRERKALAPPAVLSNVRDVSCIELSNLFNEAGLLYLRVGSIPESEIHISSDSPENHTESAHIFCAGDQENRRYYVRDVGGKTRIERRGILHNISIENLGNCSMPLEAGDQIYFGRNTIGPYTFDYS